jgi:hypothetical protein
LFGPRSLQLSKIGDAGAQRIGEALKINKALTSLKYASRIRTTPNQMRSLCCQQGALTVCGCSLFGPRSLSENEIGDEGAKHISEALKMNTALTSLKCAPASLPSQV